MEVQEPPVDSISAIASAEALPEPCDEGAQPSRSHRKMKRKRSDQSAHLLRKEKQVKEDPSLQMAELKQEFARHEAELKQCFVRREAELKQCSAQCEARLKQSFAQREEECQKQIALLRKLNDRLAKKEWDVQRILSEKQVPVYGGGTRCLLRVSWKDTWEEEGNLEHCHDMIQRYRDNKAG